MDQYTEHQARESGHLYLVWARPLAHCVSLDESQLFSNLTDNQNLGGTLNMQISKWDLTLWA